MQRIAVEAIAGGWRLRWPHSDLVLVYRSGAKAERQALQLAEMLVEQGEIVQVLIHDRRDVVVGSRISGPGDLPRSRRTMGDGTGLPPDRLRDL